MKLIFQSEASECGIACLAMILSSQGAHVDLSTVRAEVGSTSRGMNLRRLVSAADKLSLIATPKRLEPSHLKGVRRPCILHWDFNHFVVLRRFRLGKFEIHDPAVGIRRLDESEFSRHFTGVAVEFEKATSFDPPEVKVLPKASQFFEQTRGLLQSLAGIGAVALAIEICTLLVPLYTQFVIDDVASSSDFGLLTVLAIGFGLLVSMQSLLGWLRSRLILGLTQDVSVQWTTNIFFHLTKLPLEFFEQRRLGDVLSRFGSIGSIQQVLTVSAVEAVLDGVMAVASLAMMLLYAPLLTAISVTAVALQGLLRIGAYRRLETLSRERMVASSRQTNYFLETIRGMLPIKLFDNEFERRQTWQTQMLGVQALDLEKGRLDVLLESAATYIAALENIVIVWAGARLAFADSTGPAFTIGMLVVFIAYKMQFFSRTNNLAKFWVSFKMIRIHAERLSDIVLASPEPACEEVDLSHLPATIECRNLGFRYGPDEPWIFRNLDCRIEAGESVALTGPSGGGKTTFVKLLLGLLTPCEGEILYGGVRIEILGAKNVRRVIGTVMQDDALLTGTIRENIAFFDRDASTPMIERAAELAQIAPTIRTMPMGFQTLIGDLGAGLSGGQKQRLLLARALYKAPQMLVLDEATSHLDAENEAGVNASISSLALTRIIVAHRPSTIACADRVLVIDGGTVSETIGDRTTGAHVAASRDRIGHEAAAASRNGGELVVSTSNRS